MRPPTKPGRYRVTMGDGGPFSEKILLWTGSSWKHMRGWPAFYYLRRYVVAWEPINEESPCQSGAQGGG